MHKTYFPFSKVLIVILISLTSMMKLIFIDNCNGILYYHISENGIVNCIKIIQTNKVCTNGVIINEHTKAPAHEMMPLFNLNSTWEPDLWMGN